MYWPTGNPSKEYNGDDRQGDNLYASCILALDRKTGRLKWHYQFTPHDLWDWDATQTSVLVDADWQGQRRPLMLHANRNGFFYVFDRRDGTLLLARPFIKNLTWATGIGADGRPVKVPGQEPSVGGTKVCPSQDGATNWYSPSFNPSTGLYYVQTFEKCSIYMKSPNDVWQSGKSYLGGSQQTAAEPTPQRILRAIDIPTGDDSLGAAAAGPGHSWGGTLTTASGLVIVAEEGGGLMAVDASSGTPLWTFPDQPGVARLADDLHVRRPAVHRRRVRQQHHRVRASGVDMRPWLLTHAFSRSARRPSRRSRRRRSPAAASRPPCICPTRQRATTAAPASTGLARWHGSRGTSTRYFGEWFERHDPLLHDGITGPVEEFLTGDSALGYDEAKAGETFVRIGVGAVRKPDGACVPPVCDLRDRRPRHVEGDDGRRTASPTSTSCAMSTATATSTRRCCGCRTTRWCSSIA